MCYRLLIDLLVASPSFSFRPYSVSYNDSTVTPVHKSLKKALLACQRWPNRNRLASTTWENVYHPRAFVLNTPSPDTIFLSKVKVSPNWAFLAYVWLWEPMYPSQNKNDLASSGLHHLLTLLSVCLWLLGIIVQIRFMREIKTKGTTVMLLYEEGNMRIQNRFMLLWLRLCDYQNMWDLTLTDPEEDI